MRVVLICLLATQFVVAQNVANRASEYMDAMVRANHYSGVVLIEENDKFSLPTHMGLPTGANTCPIR